MYTTIQSIRSTNAAAGGHWFSPGARRFFRSWIGQRVHEGPGGVFFVSSEQFDARSPRLYTVRQAVDNGKRIKTVGGFQAYASRSAAHNAAARYARHGAPQD